MGGEVMPDHDERARLDAELERLGEPRVLRLFQSVHRRGERGQRHVRAAAGGGERAMLGDQQEGLRASNIHRVMKIVAEDAVGRPAASR